LCLGTYLTTKVATIICFHQDDDKNHHRMNHIHPNMIVREENIQRITPHNTNALPQQLPIIEIEGMIQSSSSGTTTTTTSSSSSSFTSSHRNDHSSSSSSTHTTSSSYTAEALADQIINLPGLSYNISFNQFSGYLDATPTRHLFYWYVESQSDPIHDPVVFWTKYVPKEYFHSLSLFFSSSS
jgi:Serine carboxypeptidase